MNYKTNNNTNKMIIYGTRCFINGIDFTMIYPYVSMLYDQNID